MAKDTAVEMFVGGLVLDPNTQAPVVVLKDETGEHHLPIWIGMPEATSIASAIKGLAMNRPLTHDLMITIFGEIGLSVQRVLITELKDSTYYAELVLAQGDRALILDARPSDAIAIALRASAPIFVAQTVLDQAKVTFQGVIVPTEGVEPPTDEGMVAEAQDAETQPDFKSVDKDKWEEILKQLDVEDFKYKV